MGRIESRPTNGLSYNPNESKYWERECLSKEITRVFDVCHGCRLCLNVCPAFPALFNAVDAKDGDVTALSTKEKNRVVDLCYGCKLCEVRCPYTPRERHEFQLDFPLLMLRARAVHARERGGVAIRERMLANPDLLGKVASRVPGLANWANHNSFHRLLMEKMLAIHRDKKLPDFVGETFEKWLKRGGLPQVPAAPAAKVALFHTCFINFNNPAPGKAAVAVFEKNGCAIASPVQNCCGMPALDSGDIEFARKQATANVASLLPLVRAGHRVVAINPTCSLMIREEYPRLLDTAGAKTVANAVADTNEMLFDLKRKGLFNRDFRSSPGHVAYHVPCHLKAQRIGFRSRDMMNTIPNTEVTMVEACCGHDGTWAMKKEFFELSLKAGEKAFDELRRAGAQLMATDCPLAAIQIEQVTGVRPIHPVEVLARAYEPSGFPDGPAMAVNAEA